MKRINAPLSISLFLAVLLHAQIVRATPLNGTVQDSSTRRVISYHPPLTVQASAPATTVRQAADAELSRAAAVFGLTSPAEEVSFAQQNTDDLGMSHVHYNQVQNGIPVYGAEVVVHLTVDKQVSTITGHLGGQPAIDMTATLSAAEAFESGKTYWSAKFHGIPTIGGEPKLFVLDPTLLSVPNSTESRPVWVFVLHQRYPSIQSERLFVDAATGTVVMSHPVIFHAIDREVYDCTPGTSCVIDQFDPLSGYTFGRSENQPPRGSHPYQSYDDDTDHVYELTGAIHTYYQQVFGINGANHQGGIGDGQTAAQTKTQNFTYIDTVYNGCPNAFFDGFSLNFCAGLVVTDVTAHEYQHAVTQYAIVDGSGTATGLVYNGQSGALNEAFSDIFGTLFEARVNGAVNYTIGEDFDPSFFGGPIRNMADPAEYNQPDNVFASEYYCGTEDNGGVHINSGVLNKAFYLMLNGDSLNGCTIQSIPRDRAERIFYRALTVYLTPLSNFNAAYAALINSCNDLQYGATTCNQVTRALQAVKMDQGNPCLGAQEAPANCIGSTQTQTPTPTPTPTRQPTPIPTSQPTPTPIPQPTPGQQATPTPSTVSSQGNSNQPTPSLLTVRAKTVKKSKKSNTVAIFGYVFQSNGAGLPNYSVSLTCSRKGASLSTSTPTDDTGFYAVALKVKPGITFRCKAMSAGLFTGGVTARGPKKSSR